MSVRRSLLVLFLTILVLPFFIFSGQGAETPGLDAERLSRLQLYQVAQGNVALTVSAVGRIEAKTLINVNLLASGRLAQVYVSVGDYVEAGDILAEIDRRSQSIAYEQALLNLERAELDYQDLLIVDEDSIRIAEAAVDSAWGAYLSLSSAVSEGDIRSAELAYEQALAAVEAARISRDDIGGRVDTDSAAYITADAQVGEASFNAEIARLRIDALRTSSQPQLGASYNRVLQAQRELERVQAGPTQLELDTFAIRIEQAQQQVERARIAFERGAVYAPFSGVVSALNVEVGALVAQGLPLLELTDVSELGLNVQVDEIDIGLIEVGMPVRVELDALPDTLLPATLARIATVGTNVGGIVNYDVEVTLDGIDPRVLVGMTAEATIVIDERADTLEVPNLYIRLDRRTDQAFVNVLQPDNTLVEVEVELGLRGQDSSEVISGLAVGDLIAVELSGSGLSSFFGS